MLNRFAYLPFVLAAGLLLLQVSPAQSLSLTDKVALQAAMQQHIDRQTVDGTYLYFDTRFSEVRQLYPVTGHPMIIELGEHYVLCFDFRDDQGTKVEVDLYFARKADSFVVFHTAVSSRNLLAALIDSGRAKPAE